MTHHILEHFPVADQFGFSIMDQHFRRAEPTVVLITHAETVSSGILHHDEIALGDACGQFAFFHPVIGILAKLSAKVQSEFSFAGRCAAGRYL